MIRELKRQGLSKKDIMEYLEYENKELYHLMETERFYSNKHISRLEEENKKLQERIDKAIKYIENCNYETEEYKGYVIATIGAEELLDILEGGNNDK